MQSHVCPNSAVMRGQQRTCELSVKREIKTVLHGTRAVSLLGDVAELRELGEEGRGTGGHAL